MRTRESILIAEVTEHPQIPGIEIEGELGSGAHSVVYRARQDGAPCAVKVPRVKARWTRWIYREAVALARVKHPLLPAVLEVGAIDELPYLVMDLVEGETLAETLSSGPLDEGRAVAMARQLANVLTAVHDAGLVHRDVKPRNIVVERATGALKLVDFGFATPMERVGVGDTAGTEAYAAPEQLCPPGRVDARADLYALGRVLYECLVGPSFAVGGIDGPWGADASAELVARGISPGLAEIVGGLVRRSPDDRYPDGQALESEFERLRTGRPPLGPGGYAAGRTFGRLVGREAELERIVGACRELRHGGALVLVRGPRGGGKSQVLSAARARTSDTTMTVATSCRQDDPPLSTLRRTFEGICDVVGSRAATISPDDLRAAIGNLAPVAQLIARDRLRSLLPPGAGASGSSDLIAAADSLAEGAAEILLRLARRTGPMVLVVDDAQWIDPASADALKRLAHRIAEAPIALVIGSRADDGGIVDELASVRPGRTTEVGLPALDEVEVAELVASYLGEPEADAALVSRIHAMAGGTPLGVLEVLGAFLDAGAVRPHARKWRFDPARTDDVVLPHGALALLGRRLGELPGATRTVLETAALLGTSFDEDLLGRVLELSPDELGYGLVSARRAGLVEAEAQGRHRFVHDSLREMLVEGLADGDRRRVHQRIGELLDAESSPSFEELCAAAHHLGAGERDKDPARLHRVARAAGDAALARFDNETALRFYAEARSATGAAGTGLDASYFQGVGEAELRIGALDRSLEAFQFALERTNDARMRAVLLGRISWVHQSRAEPELAWDVLERAFKAVGARMPIEDVASAVTTSARIARWSVGRVFDRKSAFTEKEIDLLCALHYQNARLGLEYSRVARVLQSSFESVALSARGGSASTRARSAVLHAIVMTALGRRDLASRSLERARDIAARHGDAATVAFCVQIHSVAASWAGQLDEALVLMRECVDVHGPWLELNEYALLVSTAELVESLRGRAHDAWPWMERAVERLRRARTRPVIAEFLIQHARAALAALGRDVRDDPWLAEQLGSLSVRDPGRGYNRLLSWGPRARYYLETGELNADFEALVRSFEQERHNPRSVHLAVSEYYVSVAHARIHQCLRAPPTERKAKLPALRRAAADLRACAKIPLLRGHALLADAWIAWFEGRGPRAGPLLSEAEALASDQSCPWVLYGVARLRAHMLRAAGKDQAARDQARVAELMARDHGAVMRARWIREELGLADPTIERSSPPRSIVSSRSSSRTNRQLAALLQVARAPRRDLRAEQQTAAILDELVNVFDAERAAIWFQSEPGSKGTMVARHRGNELSTSVEHDSPRAALLQGVHRSGVPWPSPAGGPHAALGGYEFDERRVLAVPLFLYDRPVGALCIERGREGARFGHEDRSLLALLSHQVPITLEIARLLFEREQLQSSLQQARKMEAVGQLAGGVAHDFNNMLAAMKVSLAAAQEHPALDEELNTELEIIGDAMQRAAQLTHQLLTFSRHQPLPVAIHDVNQLIANLEPMLRRVAGPKVQVVLSLSSAVDAVEVDQGGFDQALVNLVINARDAMPGGGTFTIATRNVALERTSAERANLPPGEYVEIEVSDTGEGMSAETLCRVFEPFFTTKGVGRGTGLGLAMVYAFARNCGGSVEVSSELGHGTQFRIHLKRAERARAVQSIRPAPAISTPPEPPTRSPDTILVVDDDDLVRRSISKILQRNGYRVVAVSGSTEALDVARQQGDRIALVILDVLMPGLSGPELGRRLTHLSLAAKMLFVSGFSPESIQLSEANVASELLLQKPFSQAVLLDRVRQLMQS